MITIAILARDKSTILNTFLDSLEQQTYPKDKIKLYIRTNDNTDNTQAILEMWIDKMKNKYNEIYYNSDSIDEKLKDYKPHEWNSFRFKILGKIRMESVLWAMERGTHYMVIDCDNILTKETIHKLYETNMPVIGPLLINIDEPQSKYSNYHYDIDDNGYFVDSKAYHMIYDRDIRGIIQVNVIHCTYLIRYEYLRYVCYDDDSERYEYVIFSDTMRKNGILQYLDNRTVYGYITFM